LHKIINKSNLIFSTSQTNNVYSFLLSMVTVSVFESLYWSKRVMQSYTHDGTKNIENEIVKYELL